MIRSEEEMVTILCQAKMVKILSKDMRGMMRLMEEKEKTILMEEREMMV
jgi:hypothetical protein